LASVLAFGHIAGMEKFLSRRTALGFGVAALAAPAFNTQSEAATEPALVELFTSQGCSSCPAADRLAGKLARNSDVIVVSLNVDYWDYLGWKDTLAKPEFTKRQMDYAHARGDGQVYTPQMVINGLHHAVGSNKSDVEFALDKKRAARVTVKVSGVGDVIKVEVGQGKAIDEATLWLMAVAPEISVQVERGENAGKSITYHNVVRNLVPAGMWKGDATSFSLPRKALMTAGCKACVAVLQRGYVGEVLGLGRLG
jgi:hypothetical protein